MTNQFDASISTLIRAANLDSRNEVTERNQLINETLTRRQARIFLDALISRTDLRAAALKALASPAYGDDLRAHYTTFGHSMQPRCADVSGYLHYREDFQTEIPQSDWTDAERYIDEAESAIAEFRRSR